MSDDAQRSDASPLDVARQAELFELRHSRDQLAAILSGIGEGVTVQDTNGALVFANDVAARLSGFDSAGSHATFGRTPRVARGAPE